LKVKSFYHQQSGTLSYVLLNPDSHDCVIIDPVLDIDPHSGSVSSTHLTQIIAFCINNNLKVHKILETHAHADHLTGAEVLKTKFSGSLTGISKNITLVQEIFAKQYAISGSFFPDGRDFDLLFSEGNIIKAGALSGRVLETPGHTQACVSYLFGDYVFTGDLLFSPDSGTGRCDFPGGCPESMYHSIIDKIYKLSDHCKTYPGHDYQPGGRELCPGASLREHKAGNIHLPADMKKSQFLHFRKERDKGLHQPALIHFSLQVNIRGGKLPPPEPNGLAYLKTPISWTDI